MAISNRLKQIADFVAYDICADVGTDHGYVPIYLLENEICKKVYALDINRGPLAKALENIEAKGLSGKCDIRLSDGFEKLEANEAISIVISGMGGRLVHKILLDKMDVTLSAKQLVLSPQGDEGIVKRFLLDNNYLIIREKIVYDEGKYYNIIDARNFCRYKKHIDKYSGSILGSYDEIFAGFINKTIEKHKKIYDNILCKSSEENAENEMEYIKYLEYIKEIIDSVE